MVAAVEGAGVRGMMGFSTRFSPLIQNVKRHLEEGAIGRPFHVHAQAFSSGLLAERPRWSWRTDRARTGAGVLGDLGSHLIDLNHYLLGPIEAVMASLRTFIPELVDPQTGERHPQEVDDDVALLLRFASGVHGSLALSRVGSVHRAYPIGRRHYLIDGSGGGLLVGERGGYPLSAPGGGPAPGGRAPPVGGRPPHLHHRLGPAEPGAFPRGHPQRRGPGPDPARRAADAAGD